MPRNYNTTIIDPSNAVKACVTNAKVSFKNTRETCSTLKGRSLNNCFSYLNDVLEKKDCVPMRRYGNKVGNTKQARKYGTKEHPCTKGRWPVKAAKLMLKICSNIKNNALMKNIDPEDLYVKMVSVNRAPKIYGRCYRAYGRINAFDKSPCHVQMVCVAKKGNINVSDAVLEVEE